MRLRKMAIACTLSAALTLGSSSVFAASLDDTAGLPGEVSMNKLVSLHVLPASGTSYNPDAALTRGDFVYALTQVLKLNAPKSVKIKDVSSNSKDYASVAKVIGNGLLKLDAKGNFNSKKAVTYAEFSRALAAGLGLKLSWSDRPIDYLFYLERKGVLDIDTDLDAVVTRGAAAVAIDQVITLKGTFKSDSGVVVELKGDDAVVLNNGRENVTYKLDKDASLFLSGQSDDLSSFGPGTAVQVLLNAKGEISFLSGHSLLLEEGSIVYKSGKVSINSTLRNIDLRAVVNPLPNDPNGTFTLKGFGNYSGAGVTFAGGAYVNNQNDEVTLLDLRVAKAEEKPFTVGFNGLTLDFSDDALANLSFKVADDVKITLKAASATDKDQKLTLTELTALQTGNTLTGTVEINSDGFVTSIVATAEKKTENK
ncbi:hypothetical protein E5161_01860 [Cohnella pontilimi]|uniref:SLH domain-containing protein n=1 Tax=Cohnella pontilimi TaxID=2564100 RepID=A0A4U0FI87_9BACL|nr:S-layer homology domain-containing protein [Cohnella pontilimi]TJY44164.1 hypothetical protein E5161_01860 [Cohnella pontilimi]